MSDDSSEELFEMDSLRFEDSNKASSLEFPKTRFSRIRKLSYSDESSSDSERVSRQVLRSKSTIPWATKRGKLFSDDSESEDQEAERTIPQLRSRLFGRKNSSTMPKKAVKRLPKRKNVPTNNSTLPWSYKGAEIGRKRKRTSSLKKSETSSTSKKKTEDIPCKQLKISVESVLKVLCKPLSVRLTRLSDDQIKSLVGNKAEPKGRGKQRQKRAPPAVREKVRSKQLEDEAVTAQSSAPVVEPTGDKIRERLEDERSERSETQEKATKEPSGPYFHIFHKANLKISKTAEEQKGRRKRNNEDRLSSENLGTTLERIHKKIKVSPRKNRPGESTTSEPDTMGMKTLCPATCKKHDCQRLSVTARSPQKLDEAPSSSTDQQPDNGPVPEITPTSEDETQNTDKALLLKHNITNPKVSLIRLENVTTLQSVYSSTEILQLIGKYLESNNLIDSCQRCRPYVRKIIVSPQRKKVSGAESSAESVSENSTPSPQPCAQEPGTSGLLTLKAEGETDNTESQEVSSILSDTNARETSSPQLQSSLPTKSSTESESVKSYEPENAVIKIRKRRILAPGEGQSSFKCIICDKMFESFQLLQKHLSSHYASRQNSRFSCSTCPRTFDTSADLSSHRMNCRSAGDSGAEKVASPQKSPAGQPKPVLSNTEEISRTSVAKGSPKIVAGTSSQIGDESVRRKLQSSPKKRTDVNAAVRQLDFSNVPSTQIPTSSAQNESVLKKGPGVVDVSMPDKVSHAKTVTNETDEPVCIFCSKDFPSITSLRDHYEHSCNAGSESRTSIQTVKPSRSASTAKEYYTAKVVNGETQYTCKKCKTVAASVSNMSSHVSECYSSPEKSSAGLGETSPKESHAKKDDVENSTVAKKTPPKSHTCVHCSKKFPSPNSLQNHMEKVCKFGANGVTSPKFSCPPCRKNYLRKEGLQNHLEYHCPNVVNVPWAYNDKETVQQVPTTSQADSNNEKPVDENVRTSSVTSESDSTATASCNSFECSSCSATFETDEALQSHLQRCEAAATSGNSQEESQNSSNEADQDKTNTENQSVNIRKCRHIRKHMLRCHFCKKKFRSRFNRDRHMDTVCKAFQKKNVLEDEPNEPYEGREKYVCPHCSKNCMFHQNLRDHIRWFCKSLARPTPEQVEINSKLCLESNAEFNTGRSRKASRDRQTDEETNETQENQEMDNQKDDVSYSNDLETDPEKGASCSTCFTALSSSRKLKKHKRACKGNKKESDSTLSCTSCSEQFPNKEALPSHDQNLCASQCKPVDKDNETAVRAAKEKDNSQNDVQNDNVVTSTSEITEPFSSSCNTCSKDLCTCKGSDTEVVQEMLRRKSTSSSDNQDASEGREISASTETSKQNDKEAEEDKKRKATPKKDTPVKESLKCSSKEAKRKMRLQPKKSSTDCGVCSVIFKTNEDLFDHLLSHSQEDHREVVDQMLNDSTGSTTVSSQNESNGNAVTDSEKRVDPADQIQEQRLSVEETTENRTASGDKENPNQTVSTELQATASSDAAESQQPAANQMTVCPCHKGDYNPNPQSVHIEVILLCNSCNVVFRRSNCFETHFRTSPTCRENRSTSRLPKLFCRLCGIIMDSMSEIGDHLKNHLNERINFICTICRVLFHDIGELFMNHWIQHWKNVTFIASRLSFPKHSVARIDHIISSQNDLLIVGEHVCQKCKEPFDSKELLKEHEYSCRLELRMFCEFCNSPIKDVSIQAIQQHRLTHHSVNPKPVFTSVYVSPTQSRYMCNICNVICDTMDGFVDHWLLHNSKSEKFHCKVCQADFLTLTYFFAHLNVHSNLKSLHCNVKYVPKKHECKKCRAGFETKEALDSHVQSHPFLMKLPKRAPSETGKSPSPGAVKANPKFRSGPPTVTGFVKIPYSAILEQQKFEKQTGRIDLSNMIADVQVPPENAQCVPNQSNEVKMDEPKAVDNVTGLATKEKNVTPNGSNADKSVEVIALSDSESESDKGRKETGDNQPTQPILLKQALTQKTGSHSANMEQIVKNLNQLKRKSVESKSSDLESKISNDKTPFVETNVANDSEPIDATKSAEQSRGRETEISSSSELNKNGETQVGGQKSTEKSTEFGNTASNVSDKENSQTKHNYLRVKSLSELLEASNVHKCKVCKASFDSEGSLQQHYLVVHPQVAAPRDKLGGTEPVQLGDKLKGQLQGNLMGQQKTIAAEGSQFVYTLQAAQDNIAIAPNDTFYMRSQDGVGAALINAQYVSFNGPQNITYTMTPGMIQMPANISQIVHLPGQNVPQNSMQSVNSSAAVVAQSVPQIVPVSGTNMMSQNMAGLYRHGSAAGGIINAHSAQQGQQSMALGQSTANNKQQVTHRLPISLQYSTTNADGQNIQGGVLRPTTGRVAHPVVRGNTVPYYSIQQKASSLQNSVSESIPKNLPAGLANKLLNRANQSDQSSGSESTADFHLNAEDRDGVYTCLTCNSYSTRSLLELNRHFLNHKAQPEKIKSNRNVGPANSTAEEVRPVSRPNVVAPKIYICKYCHKYQSPNEQKTRLHEQAHLQLTMALQQNDQEQPMNPFDIDGNVNGKDYDLNNQRQQHQGPTGNYSRSNVSLVQTQLQPQTQQNRQRNNVCYLCEPSIRIFDSEQALSAHFDIDHNFLCNNCPLRFISYDKLQNHKKIHSISLTGGSCTISKTFL